MPPKRRAPRAAARLTVLAEGDERMFLAYAVELLASSDRLARGAGRP
ncbi:MAG TPA: hypothetical protein VEZ14_06320 [Dehalococcoidia bacterium]|nr:hypothetical protein [Dehalococcoidia bacterium]